MTRRLKRVIMSWAVLWAFCLVPWATAETLTEASEAGEGNLVQTVEPARAPAPDVQASASPAPASGGITYMGGETYKGKKISLDFKDEELRNVIKFIAEHSDKIVVISDAIHGKLTLKLKDIPWDQALDIVLASRSLGVEEIGNVLTVYDLATLQRVEAGCRYPSASYNPDSQAKPSLAKKVFSPKHSPVGVMSAELAKLKSERGKIVVIGNDIYVEEDPGVMATMTQAFTRLDFTIEQILINVYFMRSSAAFFEKFSFQGLGRSSSEGAVSAAPGGVAPGTSEGANRSSAFTGNAKLHVVVLSEDKADSKSWGIILDASQQSDEACGLAVPRAVTPNDQEVLLRSGIECSTGSSPLIGNSARRFDVIPGVKVKPHIEGNDLLISLDIILTNPASGQAELAIGVTKAITNLTINDGETVVVGGICIDGNCETEGGVSAGKILTLGDWLVKGLVPSEDPHPEMVVFITAQVLPVKD